MTTFEIQASEVLPDASRRPVQIRTWDSGGGGEGDRQSESFFVELPTDTQERDATIERYIDALLLQATPAQRDMLRARRRQAAEALAHLYMQNRVGTFVLKAFYRVKGPKACESASREVTIHIKDTGSFIDELNARNSRK
ncbi:MAG TPA: hypothetical protein VF381_16700 [Thermoanaerobaculia bacterium]